MLEVFPGTGCDETSVMGGKGAALVRMARAGLPVPEGAVLTTAFFEPWFAQISTSEAWARVAADPDQWSTSCPAVQALRPDLDADQIATLARLRDHLGTGLYAVRSSSPEEDLATASFAGGYATSLGVTLDRLEEAVRACFASSLDARVLAYKRDHEFDALQPRIAVVVQRQLDSQVAGVAFSLNPLNNDYDEAVVDAAWGLGESVVAGLTEPDHVVVEKGSGAVLERRTGAKHTSLWLRDDGGTESREGHDSDVFCLRDQQVADLVAMVSEVEALFLGPVDIEWAWAEDRLYLLQARPVTAWVPLPDELLTEPGERRYLYQDVSLSNGLTLNVPVSPLGLDWLYEVFITLLERFVGRVGRTMELDQALFLGVGGRLYANLSHQLWLQSPATMERGNRGIDALMAATLGNIDARRYRSRRLPNAFRLRHLARVPRMMWAARHLALRGIWTMLSPRRAKVAYDRDIAVLEERLREPLDPERSVRDELHWGFDRLFDTGFAALWAGLLAGMVPVLLSDWLVRRLDPHMALRLQQGFAGNVVLDMAGLMARCANRLDLDHPEGVVDSIEARTLPEEVLRDWDRFMERFGTRGPVEMDIAVPRYRDDIRLVLSQMSAMRGSDPLATHARLAEEREQAWRDLRSRSPWRAALMWWPMRLARLYAGTRDTPKLLLTQVNHRVRRQALALGRRLVAQGRLDRPDQVFDLHLDQLDEAGDLRALASANRGFLDQLRSTNLVFPPVIDSRGRITRPRPGPETPGELHGVGVSAGIATGRVRLLRQASAHGIEPGDVLVAYTTDPGWTPLFANAAAVVLEIGGTLQHGALVAREYGKPCVVGIPDLFDRLEEGSLVEVDGAAGVVRLIP